ncbi:MAG: Fic family protein [Muribaculaceae bacterium]|nr:Fic family protein [Muribaculaceae bacterium]
MERAPEITEANLLETFANLSNLSDELISLITKINEDYEFWDTVKYKKVPDNYSNEDLWRAVLVDRLKTNIKVWDKYNIHFGLTNKMQRQCHDFDMNFGGSWATDSIISSDDNDRYLISSLMEEAISSSQMEGASTTRRVAKDMLRKKIAPKDRSQRMIFNNYQTIQFIVSNKDKPLTVGLLQHIHRLMTDNTLENSEDSGRFRQNDDVVVENSITHEVVHTPPSYRDIPQFIIDLCDFFNSDKAKKFVHPIIRGIVIHFMVAYMHPFVDGNGRTARALFYWYLLKQGYWLTEYLSISRIIYKSKNSYEKSFLYAESDKNDIGYFIAYNLRTLELAFKDLQIYIKRKTEAKQVANSFLRIGNINERQAEIIKIYYENSKEMLTVKDFEIRFAVTPTTAKSDIVGLLKIGALEEISLNKVKKGYIKGCKLDEIIKNAL